MAVDLKVPVSSYVQRGVETGPLISLNGHLGWRGVRLSAEQEGNRRASHDRLVEMALLHLEIQTERHFRCR